MKLIFKLPDKKKNFADAQKSVDSDCMKYLNEFVPVAPTKYAKSGSLHDSLKNPEAGKLIYTKRFAPHTYYDATTCKNRGNPKGTRLWFETTKRHYKFRILAGAKKEAYK
ncbi:MAG: hypothetical protein K2O60_06525 [Ruminococcus sp.]|nr:hypothetical protein [Ruminococcus sp.]